MRKPLVALSLVTTVSLGAMTVADAHAATSVGSTVSNSPSDSTVPPSYTSDASSRAGTSGAAIVQTALQYIGYPYTATGNSPSTGFSCIGFVSFVYRQNGIALPGDLGDALAYAPQVPFADLQPGDILYFQNTIWTGLSHAAIYIGGGKFIHAEWYGKGVRISSFYNDPLDYNYWIGKYLGANRPWAGAAVAPVITYPNPKPAPGNPQSSTAPQLGTGPVASAQTRLATGPSSLVTVPSLNVRSTPSRKATVQTVIGQGTSVVILGKKNGWYKVQLPDGSVGWIVAQGIGQSSAQVSATATVPNGSNGVQPTIGSPTGPVRAGTASVSTARSKVAARVNGLRVHASPSLTGGVVTTLYRGEKVTVLARSAGWVEVQLPNGATGWVSSSYVGSRSTTYRSPSTNRSSSTYRTTSYSKPATAASSFGGTAVRVATNVRATPSLKGGLVTTLVPGQKYRVLYTATNGWVRVQLANGTYGWISGTVVGAGSAKYGTQSRTSASRSYSSSTTHRSTTSGPVLTAGVRIHSGPGLKAPVVTLAAAGTHVTVLGYSGSWVLVRLPKGQTGYVSAAYVR